MVYWLRCDDASRKDSAVVRTLVSNYNHNSYNEFIIHYSSLNFKTTTHVSFLRKSAKSKIAYLIYRANRTHSNIILDITLSLFYSNINQFHQKTRKEQRLYLLKFQYLLYLNFSFYKVIECLFCKSSKTV